MRLSDVRVYGGWYPYWDDSPNEQIYFRLCSVTGYPSSSTADTIRQLNARDFPYRWVNRGIALDKNLQAGLLRHTQGNWGSYANLVVVVRHGVEAEGSATPAKTCSVLVHVY